MGYDWRAEADRARRSTLSGHTTPTRHGQAETHQSERRTTTHPARRSMPTPADVEDLCARHPVYRVDGTRDLLLWWLEVAPRRVRWFIRHCI